MTDTVRERALKALVALFETQTAKLPAGDPYGFAWQVVTRAPGRDWMWKKKYSIGVYDMHEDKTHLNFVVTCSLRVALEVYLVAENGEQPSEAMNEVFGAIQRRIREDHTLGGVVIDVMEVSNDMQVSDENEKLVSGVIMLNVKYRHSINDPRRVV